MLVELAAGTARARIDTDLGGRIASLRAGDLELLVTAGADPLDWGLYPMAPWAGRVRHGCFRFGGREHQLPVNQPPHALHGTVYDQPWKVDHADDTDTVLVTELTDPWPFPGRIVHRIRLADDALDLRLEIWAHDEPFPASCGWHPWFRRHLARGAAARVTVDAAAIWQRDPDGIPSGALVAPTPGPWDECFTDLARPAEVTWDGALQLTVETSCMDVVVYDELDHAVCVEPQTGPPDALRLTPVVVEPGLPLVAEATFRWRTLS